MGQLFGQLSACNSPQSASSPLARRRQGMALISLPDELLQVLSAELDAAAVCRLSQVDKAMQQWTRLHARERVYTWRHARAWLILCERAKVRVLHRRAGRRGRLSVVWNHFAPVGAAVNRVRCCCTEGIANGSSCGVQLTTRSTAPLWNHLMYAHPTLYGELRMRNPSVLG